MSTPPEANDAQLAGQAARVAAAVLAVPGVAGLHGGMFGEVATYLPGQRVTGIRVVPGGIAVHLVAREGSPLRQVATAVQAAAADAIDVHADADTDGVVPAVPVRVDVTIEDLAPPVAHHGAP